MSFIIQKFSVGVLSQRPHRDHTETTQNPIELNPRPKSLGVQEYD